MRAKGFGARVPVGIEDAAFARLLEYPFEGEDAELASMALQLVASCEGDVVRAHHVDALIARERERGDDRKAKRALELEGRARDPADVVEPRSARIPPAPRRIRR